MESRTKPRMLQLIILGAAFIGIVALVGFGGQLQALLGIQPEIPAELAGKTAPAFEAETMSGKTLRFPDDFEGRLVLLDFWATWCPPCVAAIPHLREAHEEFAGQGLSVVSISLDGPRVGEDSVSEFIQRKRMDWPHIYAGAERVARQYNVSAIPTMFLVDGDSGEIVAGGQQLEGPFIMGTIKDALGRKGG